MKRLYLVRHGQTSNNLKGQKGTFGSNDPLNEIGIMGVRQLNEALLNAGLSFQIIVTSPLARARQTAIAIADAFHIDVVEKVGLTEFDAGEWRDIPIQRAIAPYTLMHESNRPNFRPPGGESWIDIADRMCTVVTEMFEMGYTDVLIVSHASPIMFCAGKLLELRPEVWLGQQEPTNSSVWLLTNDGDGWRDDGILSRETCG